MENTKTGKNSTAAASEKRVKIFSTFEFPNPSDRHWTTRRVTTTTSHYTRSHAVAAPRRRQIIIIRLTRANVGVPVMGGAECYGVITHHRKYLNSCYSFSYTVQTIKRLLKIWILKSNVNDFVALEHRRSVSYYRFSPRKIALRSKNSWHFLAIIISAVIGKSITNFLAWELF